MDIMEFMPFNRRTLTAMRCVSKPFRSAVQSSDSPWSSHKEIMLSRYGQCILFNAQEDEDGRSDFSLYSVTPIGRKFRTHSAKLLGRYHALVANGLTRLALHYAVVESAFFEPLAVLANLRELELVSCRSLTSVSEASRIKNLEVLEVYLCPLEQDGVSGLELPRLKKLSLRSCSKLSNLNEIDPATVSNLQEVCIENCGVYDDTSALFFSNLSSSLCSLHLGGTMIDEALKLIPEEALRSLTSLHLCFTPIHSSTLLSISKPLGEQLEFLSIEGCTAFEDLSALSNLAALRFLDISRLEKLDGIECLCFCKELEMFRCAYTEFCSAALLYHLRKLRILDASYTNLTDYTLMYLEDFPELDTVVLSGCVSISSVNAFHNCPKLRRIFCSKTPVTNEGVEMLTDCKMLEELDLRMTKVTDVNQLADCPSLKVINVCGSVQVKERIERLLENPNIEVICDSFNSDGFVEG